MITTRSEFGVRRFMSALVSPLRERSAVHRSRASRRSDRRAPFKGLRNQSGNEFPHSKFADPRSGRSEFGVRRSMSALVSPLPQRSAVHRSRASRRSNRRAPFKGLRNQSGHESPHSKSAHLKSDSRSDFFQLFGSNRQRSHYDRTPVLLVVA